jgi:hypothetical protein
LSGWITTKKEKKKEEKKRVYFDECESNRFDFVGRFHPLCLRVQECAECVRLLRGRREEEGWCVCVQGLKKKKKKNAPSPHWKTRGKSCTPNARQKKKKTTTSKKKTSRTQALS